MESCALVEIQKVVHAGVLLELLLLREDADDLQLVLLNLVQPIATLPGVRDQVTRHPGREETAGHQLGKSMQGEVGEQARVREVVLVPAKGETFLVCSERITTPG